MSFDWPKVFKPAVKQQLAQRLTTKVIRIMYPRCLASCSYVRWCRKHGFLNHSNSMGRFAFFFVILGCFNLDVERIYPLKKYDRNFCILVVIFYLFFAELRKKARQLENEIDLKLVSFSKLGTNYSQRDGYKER